MSFFTQLEKLCTDKGIKPAHIAQYLGLSSSVPTSWKNGITPNAENLVKIADYFSVSVDYLLEHEVKEKNQPSQIEKVEIKPAFARNRKETVDMFMYRYQNIIEENYFWILIELCSHIKSKDGLELFATLCNAMIEKGYPALEYYVEAHRYFTDGIDKPIVWNEACPKLTIEEKQYAVENIAKELSDKFAKDYAQLLDDKSFRDTAKLYNEYPEELRVQILEMIINWLTKYIQQNEQFRHYFRLPNDVLGRN